jgi:transposase
MNPTSYSGYKYAVLFTDDKTSLRVIEFSKTKDSIFELVVNKLEYFNNQYKKYLNNVRIDNGREFHLKKLENFLNSKGINLETTTPYTPEQNGIAERANRILMDKVQTTLIANNIPKILCEFIAKSVILITNITAKSKGNITPYEEFNDYLFPNKNNTPNLSFLRTLDYEVTVYIPKEIRKNSDKFGNYTEKGILIGFKGSTIYTCYIPNRPYKSRIVHTSHIRFNEALRKEGEDLPCIQGNSPQNASSLESVSNTLKSTRKDLPCSQGNSSQNAVKTSNPICEDLPCSTQGSTAQTGVEALNPPDSSNSTKIEVILPKLPVEKRNEFKKFDDSFYGLFDYPDTEIAYANTDGYIEPKTLKQALNSPEREYWLKAVHEELKQIIRKGTFKAVDKLKVAKSNRIPLTVKWVFKRKIDKNGNIDKYKARLCVRGFKQKYGVDYFETFALGAKPATWRILFALAAYYDWEIEQIDIIGAFLHGKLHEEVYITPINGLDEFLSIYPEYNFGWKSNNSQIIQLINALYSLKQSPRQWQIEVKKALKKLNFEPLISDESTYYNKDLRIFIITYVDDFLIIRPTLKEINHIKSEIGKVFEIKDLGPVSYFLGIQVFRDRKNQTIYINQSNYITRLLENNGFIDIKPSDIPLSPGLPKALFKAENEVKNQADSEDLPGNSQVTHECQHLIGGLMYAITQTRPDLAFPVAYLARYMQKPSNTHIKAVKGIFKYLKQTKNLSITYNGQIKPELFGYCDSDFAGDYTTRKSTYGCLYMLNNGCISWKSKRQSTIALSTIEAEFNGLKEATREAIWLKNLLFEIGIKSGPILIKGDNTGAINLAYNPEYHQRIKHTAIRYYYVRQEVKNKNILIQYISTNDMPADGLTKPLPKDKFNKFIKLINLRNYTPFNRSPSNTTSNTG